MMIKNMKPVGSVDPVTSKPQREEIASRPRQDRVTTVEAQQALALAHSVKDKVGLSRSAMLTQVESAIRAGTYSPSAGQLAYKLLAAAEIDAQLQAMLQS